MLQSFFGCYDSFQNSVNTSDHIRTFRKYVEEDAEAPQYLRRLRKALKIKSVESGDGRIKAILNNCSVNIFVDVAVYCERKEKTLMQLFDEGEIDVVLCKG